MKQTKQGMIEQCNQMSQENTRLWQALIDTQRGLDQFVGRFTEDGWTVTVKMVRATGAMGGILLIDSQNAKDKSFSVSLLDDEHRYYQHAYLNGEYGYKMRDLIGKAMMMRNRALDAENAEVSHV